MRIGGIRDVTYRTADLAAAVAWWRDELGLVVVDGSLEEGRVVLEAPDERQVVLSTSAAEPVVVSWSALGEGAPGVGEERAVTDPSGYGVVLAGPPVGETMEDIERRLTDFIVAAGPDVQTVADAVAALVAAAVDQLPRVLGGVAHNTVLAAQLLLSQRARQVAPGAEQWQLQAASTLLSGPVIAGAERT